MLIYRNAEEIHGQREFGNPWLSQTSVFIQRCCEPLYINLFSENINFSQVHSFCCWAVAV